MIYPVGTRLVILLLLCSVIANVFFAIIIFRNNDEVQTVEAFAKEEQRYPLLSKRILHEYPQDLLLNFLELRKTLQEQVGPYGENFGLYFEYLPTGTSIAINANNEFYAASLFKVPVIMAYYHGLERQNLRNDQELIVKKENLDSEFGDLWQKGEGYKIKSSDAIRLALTESDNTAAKTIADFVTDDDFQAVYQALDIDLKADARGASVSARTYSSVLKALYFSSVLSKDSSEEILDLLTKSKFHDKIEAGVPESVLVAHKIGNFVNSDGTEGFRDCGIVYVPRRPYLLCMFSVSDEQTARERMQQTSKTIYDYVVDEARVHAH